MANYLKNELYTRDKQSKKVDEIIQKSKENAVNKNVNNLNDALFLEDKKLKSKLRKYLVVFQKQSSKRLKNGSEFSNI